MVSHKLLYIFGTLGYVFMYKLLKCFSILLLLQFFINLYLKSHYYFTELALVGLDQL